MFPHIHPVVGYPGGINKVGDLIFVEKEPVIGAIAMEVS
jgi:hypothetical protein